MLCRTQTTKHTDLIHFKNGKKYFWQKLHKIDSNMSHLSYNGCQKVRKIEKGQKNFEGQSKGRIRKNLKFSLFFCYLGSIGNKNFVPAYFQFSRTKRPKRSKRPNKGHNIESMSYCSTNSQNLVTNHVLGAYKLVILYLNTKF